MGQSVQTTCLVKASGTFKEQGNPGKAGKRHIYGELKIQGRWASRNALCT